MRRSICLIAGGFLIFGAVGEAAVREMDFSVRQPRTPASVAIDVLHGIERSDQMESPDCAQLTRLAMQAEVNALGVQFATHAQPQSLSSSVLELQESVNQLRSSVFENPQVDRLRDQYASLLHHLLQTVKPSDEIHTAPEVLDQQVKQVTQFNQDRILFGSCQVS